MPANSQILENGYFLLNDGSGRLLRGALRIEDGRIAKIAGTLQKKRGEKSTDLKGGLVIPGFVQTHVHLCQTLFRNLADDLPLLDWLKQRIWPMEGAHTEASLYVSARLGISELLAGGTTTILDMGTVRHTDAIFTAAEELGIRAFIGKCLMDRAENPPQLRETAAAALAENRELFERWHGRANGRLRYANAPRFLLSCTDGLMRELKEFSAAHDLIVHTHSSENRSEVEKVRSIYGCENIEAFARLGLANPRLVLAHCVWLSASEIDLLNRNQVKVSHCPSSNLKLASGVAPVPTLRAKGVSVSLGADGAPCNNRLDMFTEMRLATLLQKPQHGAEAMNARIVFEMATIEGAKALGLGEEIGSLELGKKADLAWIDFARSFQPIELNERSPDTAYSALVYSASPQNVAQTWVDGNVVHKAAPMKEKRALSIVSEALQQQKKLLRRL